MPPTARCDPTFHNNTPDICTATSGQAHSNESIFYETVRPFLQHPSLALSREPRPSLIKAKVLSPPEQRRSWGDEQTARKGVHTIVVYWQKSVYGYCFILYYTVSIFPTRVVVCSDNGVQGKEKQLTTRNTVGQYKYTNKTYYIERHK